jgi:hypothetical protein
MDDIAYLSPQIIQTSTGDYVINCTKLSVENDESNLSLFKINKDGDVVTQKDIIHDYDESSNWIDIWPSVYAVEDGNIIMFWNAIEAADQDTTIGGWGARKFFAQKYDTNIEPVWEDYVTIINPPNLFAFRLDHSVTLEQDNNNGLYIAWFDNRDFESNVRLNHISSDGTLLFDEEGLVIVEPKSACSNMSPMLNYDVSLDAVFIYWIEECIKTNHRGSKYGEYAVYTNKITSGNNTWELSDEGYATIPQECYFTPFLQHASSLGNGDQILFFLDSKNSLEAVILDQNGMEKGYTLISAPSLDELDANLLNDKLDISVTDLANDQWVSVWVNHLVREDEYHNEENFFLMYAQNLNIDGTLGPKPLV